ncbi:Na+/H+ antiporter NhaC, partial [Staphylococcus aureus]
PLIVIIFCVLFKMATVPVMLISSVYAIIQGPINYFIKMTDGFKEKSSVFKESMIHQSQISSRVKSLLEQGGLMRMTQKLV